MNHEIKCPNTDCAHSFDPQQTTDETIQDGHTIYCPKCDCEMDLSVSAVVEYTITGHEFDGKPPFDIDQMTKDMQKRMAKEAAKGPSMLARELAKGITVETADGKITTYQKDID